MTERPKTREDLNCPCVIYMGPNKRIPGTVVGITFEANPTVDVQTEQGIIKSVPANDVRMT